MLWDANWKKGPFEKNIFDNLILTNPKPLIEKWTIACQHCHYLGELKTCPKKQ